MLAKIITIISGLLVVLYVIGAIALYLYQREILYIPSIEYDHQFDGFQLENEQELLNIISLNPGKKRAIIYFGGNAEAVVFNAEPFLKNFSDYTVYLANYRGYGGSTGEPTEEGLYSDSLALYDLLAGEHESVSVMGRSLGSGVATYLASQRPVSHLALITPYDSIKNVVQAHVPIYPIGLLIKDEYNSVEKAQRVSAPVFIVMAELDKVIPRSHSIELFKAFRAGQVSSINIEGADHNNLTFDSKYYPSLTLFFNL